MKIALLTHDSAPFGEWVRINGIAAGLRDQGHETDILMMDRYKALRALSPSFITFGVSKLSLLIRTFSLPRSKETAKAWTKCILSAFYLIPILRRGGYHILISETHYAGLCAWLMRPQLDVQFYMDFHGTAEELSGKRAYYKEAFQLEGVLLRDCDFAVSCSGPIRQHLIAKHGGDPTSHIVCHNGTELALQMASHRLPFRVIFAGLFAHWQRVMDFVEAARRNSDPEIEFYLMGGGESEAEVLAYIKKHDVKITWLGYKPREEARNVFSTMHVGVAPYTNSLVVRMLSPLKILDYAACGLPVVTVASGEWSELLDDFGAGVICQDCNADALLAAIHSLKDKARWTTASSNAQRFVRETRTWPVVLTPLYEHLRSLDLASFSPGTKPVARR
jgi:glycosyltransferase involved in cell wall biosynthesis